MNSRRHFASRSGEREAFLFFICYASFADVYKRQNVISILSLTELGFGTAAIFSLYKPLAEKDEQKVAALMNLYAKIYHVLFGQRLVKEMCIRDSPGKGLRRRSPPGKRRKTPALPGRNRTIRSGGTEVL